MSAPVRRAWRFLRSAKLTAYILLILGPAFIRPLAFAKRSDQPQPAYAKLPGLWGTPLLVATVVAAAIESLYKWIFWREISRVDPRETPGELFLQLHQTERTYYWAAFILTAVAVYALSLIRWGYHLSAIRIIKKWRPALIDPPPIYFVVTTAAWGLWLAVYLYAVTYGLWYWTGPGDFSDYLSEYVRTHQEHLIVGFLCIGAGVKIANRNSQMGMKALYDGSHWLSLLVDLVAVLAMTLLAYLVLRLQGHPAP